MKWEEFEPITCIHMKKREDRRALLRKVEKSLGIPIQFYHPTKHPNGAVQGCYESHQAVIRSNLHTTWCTVLEDDIEECTVTQQLLDEVLRFLHNRNDWDIFYLGCFPDVLKFTQHWEIGNIFKVRAAQTHAYIIHQRFMRKVVDTPFKGIPIDEFYIKNAQCYAILPSLFFQAASASDVSSNSLISAFRGKNAIVAAVENYCLDFGISFRLLIILFAALCVAVYSRKQIKVR